MMMPVQARCGVPPTPVVPASRVRCGVALRPRIERILAEVAVAHRISRDRMIAPGRKRRQIEARDHAAYRLAAETDLTLLGIAFALGRKDHCTAHWMIRRHAERHDLPLPARGKW